MWALMGLSPNSCSSSRPSRRMPVPPSKTRIWFVSVRISIHEVLPPYAMFSFCGVGVEPRTPQNRTRMNRLPLPRNGQYKPTKLQESWEFSRGSYSRFFLQQQRLPAVPHPDPRNISPVQPLRRYPHAKRFYSATRKRAPHGCPDPVHALFRGKILACGHAEVPSEIL